MAPEPNTSVDQIFDTLNLLVASGGPLGVAEVARELQLPTSTAHRLLATLGGAGFAERDSTGAKYELGVRAHTLVHGLFRHFGVQRTALPVLNKLTRELGETATLDVRVGWLAVRVAGFEGWNEIHAGRRIGQAVPLAQAAGGLAILADLPEDDVDLYLRFEGQGRRSASRTRALKAHLAQVRETGYARLAEPEGGGAEIAFPVHAGDRAIASICVEGRGPLLAEPPAAALLAKVRKLVGELERTIAEQPALAHDPFAHLDAQALTAAVSLQP